MAGIDPVIAEVLKSLGRLEAKVDMLMAEEKSDEAGDKKEGEAEGEYKDCLSGPSPEFMSNMLQNVGPVFDY